MKCQLNIGLHVTGKPELNTAMQVVARQIKVITILREYDYVFKYKVAHFWSEPTLVIKLKKIESYFQLMEDMECLMERTQQNYMAVYYREDCAGHGAVWAVNTDLPRVEFDIDKFLKYKDVTND